MAERRVFTRIGFNTAVCLITPDGQLHHIQLQDISLHGALVTAPEPWLATIDTPLELRIPLDGEDETIIMHTQQRYHKKQDVGLECQKIDINSASLLKRLVELNLGDEVLLQRQLSELLLASNHG